MKRRVSKIVAVMLVCLLLLATGWAWHRYGSQGDVEPPGNVGYAIEVPVVQRVESPFRIVFDDPEYDPIVGYLEDWEDAEDIPNLATLQETLNLTPEQIEFLLANGIVGIAQLPERSEWQFQNGLPLTRFYDVSDWAFHSGLPMLVTSDQVLDAFHHAFAGILKDLEQEHLITMAINFSNRMVQLSDEQRNDLPGGHQHLAEANVVFFAVPLRLLSPHADIPVYAEATVDSIVSMIHHAIGMKEVPTFPYLEDFSMYEPRGHYADTERLGDYFRAIIWYGRMTFPGDDKDMTRRAVLASLALREDISANHSYLKLRQPIDFLVGTQDDLTYMEYAVAADFEMGPLTGDHSPLFDDKRLGRLQAVLEALRPQTIDPEWVGSWGLRFMGQASVLDSYIFQQCIDPEVTGRWFPSGLDLMAALGSDEAWSREDLGGPHGAALNESLRRVRAEVASRNDSDWGETVYDAWLHSLQALNCNDTGPGHPRFMRSDAWKAKELNTQLASWTQLAHDTLLYRKPTSSYTGLEGGGDVYVEPVPELYSRLRATVNITLEGLRAMDLTTPAIESGLKRYLTTLEALEELAICQLRGVDPANTRIYFTAKMAHVFLVWSEDWNWYAPPLDNGPTVLVADVHTYYDEGGAQRCLQEGVGQIKLVVVIAPTVEGTVAFVGPVFQHHEFTLSVGSGRLTDKQWAEMLEDGTAPDPAPWAQAFMP